MGTDVIIFIAEICIITFIFFFNKYLANNQNTRETITDITAKISIIIDYADAFVLWAKQFMKDSTGSEKMNEVVNRLNTIAKRYDLDISEEEIRAIAQRAYDLMIANKEETK